MHPPISHSDPSIAITSAVAMIAAPLSMWVKAAPVITVLVGTAGLVWYALLFTKEILHWWNKRRRQRKQDEFFGLNQKK